MIMFRALSALVLTAAWAAAQTSVPFTLDGPLEKVSATSATQFNTGGSVTVSGVTITIPENLLVQFPAAFIPFADFAANAGQYTGFEVSIDGNYVDNKPIAGRFFISQLIAAAGAGIITSVNTDGTINIAGGPTLRVNTPNGVYATAYTQRPFLTADEENPSISSFSGYPMCVPRGAGDNDCLLENRAPNGDRVYTPKNTSAMAPFIPGDYVTWAGVTNGPDVLVYTLVAENVQQLTKGDSGDPVYVRVEDVIIAINDNSANVEVGTTKFIGYVSDNTASVSVYRVDVDPCTGDEFEFKVADSGLKAGDVRNKFDIRFTDLTTTKSAQQYRVKASKGAKTVAKGIKAGQFTAPISEVVWPEVNVPGSPWPENAFQLFGHLKDGFVFNNKQWGQLNPWPGKTAPAKAKTCTGNELTTTTPTTPPAGALPKADAGVALTKQVAGTLITIAGANTNTDLTNAQLTFAWSGPAGLTINNADQPKMNFVNPWLDTTTPRTSTFTLKICLATDNTKCSSATVDVTTDTTVDTVTITSYQFATKGGGTLSVKAKSNNVMTGAHAAALQVSFSGGAFISMTQDTANPDTYTISRTGFGKQPTSVAVKSSLGSKVVTTTTLI